VERIKASGKWFLWISVAAILGCTPPAGSCDEKRPCQEGSSCVEKKGVGVCVWGKIDPQTNQIVPDVRILSVEGELSDNKRTSGSALKLQAIAYGASLGTETFLFKDAQDEPRALSCEEQSEQKGERRRLQCSLQAQDEGHYAFEIAGHGVNGTTVESFEWTYDTTAPKAHVHLESRADWGRDGFLYLQLEAKECSGDIAWERSEVFLDNGVRATQEACPPSLPDKAHARCFAVPLSTLPNLPHGAYALNVTTHLKDDVGNGEQKRATFPITINRVSWKQPGFASKHRLVVTQEGGVVVQLDSSQMAVLDAKNEGISQRRFLSNGSAQQNFMLMGNHEGRQVLVTTCASNGNVGLQAVDPLTGHALTTSCSASRRGQTLALALLRGNANQSLVVLRQIEANNVAYLEACQLKNGMGFAFQCTQHEKPILKAHAGLVVRPHSATEAVVYASSENNAWLAFPWEWQGNQGAWKEVSEGLNLGAPLMAVGTRYAWGGNWVSPWEMGSAPHRKPSDDTKTLPDGLKLFAVDVDDSLFAFSEEEGLLVRYSSAGALMKDKPATWSPQEGFLLEDGTLLVAGAQGIVAAFSAQLEEVWREDFSNVFGSDASLRQATLVPHSQTRSILVVEMEKNGDVVYGGILLDVPGLKKDAPWPMQGHDMGQSFNSSVSPEQCWDGVGIPSTIG